MVFDEYVGLTFLAKGRDRAGLDCWGLTRLVLAERAGIIMPRYDDQGHDDIDGLSATYLEIPREEARALDCAILLTDVKVRRGWCAKPIHIGVFIDAGHVLHIEEGHCSRIVPATTLRIHKVVRVT